MTTQQKIDDLKEELEIAYIMAGNSLNTLLDNPINEAVQDAAAELINTIRAEITQLEEQQ